MAEGFATSRARLARCCCGSLRIATTGEPLAVIACFCQECQRRTGAAFAVSTYWMLGQVRRTGRARRYVRPAQEGRMVTLHFCPTCGSSVFWELPERRPGQMGIAMGSFCDPEFPAPSMSVWEQSKPGWISIPDADHFMANPPRRRVQGGTA